MFNEGRKDINFNPRWWIYQLLAGQYLDSIRFVYTTHTDEVNMDLRIVFYSICCLFSFVCVF